MKEIFLKTEFNGATSSYSFSYDNKNWITINDKVDVTFMSIKNAWGFVGNILAMYSTSLGKPSNNVAYFNWFEYTGNDEVYNTMK